MQICDLSWDLGRFYNSKLTFYVSRPGGHLKKDKHFLVFYFPQPFLTPRVSFCCHFSPLLQCWSLRGKKWFYVPRYLSNKENNKDHHDVIPNQVHLLTFSDYSSMNRTCKSSYWKEVGGHHTNGTLLPMGSCRYKNRKKNELRKHIFYLRKGRELRWLVTGFLFNVSVF